MSTLAQTLGPPTWVDGPYPVVRPYRLLDVATIVDDLDPHWRAGAQVYSYPPDLPHTWNPCPDGSSQQGATKAEGGVIPIPLFNAYQVYLAESCGARGIGAVPSSDAAQQRFTDRALAVFAAVESYGIEAEFAKGISLPGNPFLADENAEIVNGGSPVGPVLALALLEEMVGQTGRGGVIHATPGTVTAFESTGFTLDVKGAKLVTRANGTPIVSGTGYTGSWPEGHGPAPDDPVDGGIQQWAYATGPVTIRRSAAPEILPGRLSEALDRETNEVTYRVERDYLVDWDTVLQAAVLVDWSL